MRRLEPDLEKAIIKLRIGLEQYERYEDDMQRRVQMRPAIHWPVAFSKAELRALVAELNERQQS